MRKKPVTAKQKATKKIIPTTYDHLSITMLDPDFSLYSEETEEAHTIKAVIGKMPTHQDNW